MRVYFILSEFEKCKNVFKFGKNWYACLKIIRVVKCDISVMTALVCILFL